MSANMRRVLEEMDAASGQIAAMWELVEAAGRLCVNFPFYRAFLANSARSGRLYEAYDALLQIEEELCAKPLVIKQDADKVRWFATSSLVDIEQTCSNLYYISAEFQEEFTAPAFRARRAYFSVNCRSFTAADLCAGCIDLYSNNMEHARVNGAGCLALQLVGCSRLQRLDLSNNALTTLNLENFTNMRHISLNNNKIQRIALPNSVETIDLSQNMLQELDLRGLGNLRVVKANYNGIHRVWIDPDAKIEQFFAYGNSITVADPFYQLKQLKLLNLDKNGIITYNISHNTSIVQLQLLRNPISTVICNYQKEIVDVLQLTQDSAESCRIAAQFLKDAEERRKMPFYEESTLERVLLCVDTLVELFYD